MAEAVSGGDTTVTEVQYLEKDALLHGIEVREADFEIEDLGTIRLRGMTAKQGLEGLRGLDADPLMRFQKIILMGVMHPKMTDVDLALLADGKIGIVQEIASEIMKLSGLDVTKDDLNEQVDAFLGATNSENSSSSSASKNSEESPPS